MGNFTCFNSTKHCDLHSVEETCGKEGFDLVVGPCNSMKPFDAREDFYVSNSFICKLDASGPIEVEQRRPVAFHSHAAVPIGWELSDEPAPNAFHTLGRDARVIVSRTNDSKVGEEGDRQALVLWAISEASLDVERADQVYLQTVRRQSALFRLWNVQPIVSLGALVAAVQYPEGLALDDYICRFGFLDERRASRLCRSLLVLIHAVNGWGLHFWGFLLPSMVYIDESDASLRGVLPIGLLFSDRGFMAAFHALESWRIAPEQVSVVSTGTKLVFDSKSMEHADLFAVATLILSSLLDVPPLAMQSEAAEALPLSPSAADFFLRALQPQPVWRLSVAKALAHPWLHD